MRKKEREGGGERGREEKDKCDPLPWSAAEINFDMKLLTVGAMTASIPNRTPTTHTHTHTHKHIAQIKLKIKEI